MRPMGVYQSQLKENPISRSLFPSNAVRNYLIAKLVRGSNGKATFTLTRRSQWSGKIVELAEAANGLKRFQRRTQWSELNHPLGYGEACRARSVTQWNGKTRSLRLAEPMAAFRLLPGSPTSYGPQSLSAGPGDRFPRPRGRWRRPWCWLPGCAWRAGLWRSQGRGGRR